MSEAVEAVVQLHVEQLTLRRGWSASVVTDVGGRPPRTATEPKLPDAESWRALLETLVTDPTTMPGYAQLKYSEKGEVFRAQPTWSGGALDVVCKQGRTQGLLRRRLDAWRSSRARVGFERGLSLLRAGIATALPLAVVERKTRHRQAWLIAEFISGAVDLDQVALALLPQIEPGRRRRVKDAILREIIDLFDRMEKHGIGHRDLKASNVMLTDWDSRENPVRLWLVDMEGVRRRRASSERRRRQPLVRLAASLLGYAAVTRTDFCRFVQGYLERRGMAREKWKRHYRELADESADYVRRARRRKNNKLDGYHGCA